jgi:hypothetical protein
MEHPTIWLFVAVLLAGSAYGQSLDEVVIADERVPDSAHAAWKSMPAVYVPVTDETKREMDRAIDGVLKDRALFCLKQHSCSWLEKPLRRVYLHGLLGDGQSSKDGYVCPSAPTIPALKYYSTAFVWRRRCLPLFWDAVKNIYTVSDR